MSEAEEKNRTIRSQPLEGLESPFLDEELFVGEVSQERAAHLAALEAESPFQHAFESAPGSAAEPEIYEDEFSPEKKDETLQDSYPEFFHEPDEDEDEALPEESVYARELYDEDHVDEKDMDELEDEWHEEEFDERLEDEVAEYFVDEEGDLEAEDFLYEVDDEFTNDAEDEILAELLANELDIPESEEYYENTGEPDDDEVVDELEDEVLERLNNLTKDQTAFEEQSPPPIQPTKEPLAVPVSDPVPFAPSPPMGSYWPVRSTDPRGREVAFQATDGSTVGNKSRVFMAGRTSNKKGKTIKRYHVGIDLYAKHGDPIIASEDGVIRNFHHFLGKTRALIVEHANVVINYGEVASDSLRRNGLDIGSSVKAGQIIGYVGLLPKGSSMLHFETYRKGTTSTKRWYRHKKPPSEILNPTKYLLFLQQNGLVEKDATGQPALTVPGTSPAIDLKRAVRLNRHYGQKLGWHDFYESIERFLGFTDISPSEEALAEAVAKWQRSQGLKVDGIIGPNTWKRMQTIMGTGRLPAPVVTPGSGDVRQNLAILGYNIKPDSGTEVLHRALRDFQEDVGLHRSGELDARTEAKLQGLISVLQSANEKLQSMRHLSRFRLTSYYVANEADFRDKPIIPVLDKKGQIIAKVDPAFFLSMSVEGTGRLRDGRLLNVVGSKSKGGRQNVSHLSEYQQLLEVARKRYKKRLRPDRISATGVRLKDGRVVSVLAFHEVPERRRGKGYGIRRGIAHDPFLTLAADIGAYRTSDKRFRGKGGLVPAGTRVFILELAGIQLPDGSLHDGWCVVNDTGSAIFGAHFDVFTGSRAWSKQVSLPRIGHIWFDQSEDRCPPNYVYGLHR